MTPLPLLEPKILRFDHRPFTTDEMHDAACAHGEEMFSRYGECKPTWILNATGRLVWIETPWRSAREKDDITNKVAFMLQTLQGHAYTLISEAYVAIQKPGKDGKLPEKTVMPSQRPKHERDDILMIVTQPRMGKQLISRYLVTERQRGPNLLGPRVDEDYDGMKGSMTDLFDRRFR